MIDPASSVGAARPTDHRRWAAPVGVAVGAGTLACLLAAHDPFRPGGWPGCPFHALTGLWCPLCGSSRAVYALAHGHVALMADSNPLLPLWLLLALWGWLWWVSELGLVRARIPGPTSTRRSQVGLGTVAVVFWVTRNLPALHVLAPHGHL